MPRKQCPTRRAEAGQGNQPQEARPKGARARAQQRGAARPRPKQPNADRAGPGRQPAAHPRVAVAGPGGVQPAPPQLQVPRRAGLRHGHVDAPPEQGVSVVRGGHVLPGGGEGLQRRGGVAGAGRGCRGGEGSCGRFGALEIAGLGSCLTGRRGALSGLSVYWQAGWELELAVGQTQPNPNPTKPAPRHPGRPYPTGPNQPTNPAQPHQPTNEMVAFMARRNYVCLSVTKGPGPPPSCRRWATRP
jgi:hypothetical protein